MSDLQRSFARAKLAQLPPEPPFPSSLSADDYDGEDEIRPLPGEADDDEGLPADTATKAGSEDDSSSSADSASSASSTGTIKPEPRKGRFAKPRG